MCDWLASSCSTVGLDEANCFPSESETKMPYVLITGEVKATLAYLPPRRGNCLLYGILARPLIWMSSWKGNANDDVLCLHLPRGKRMGENHPGTTHHPSQRVVSMILFVSTFEPVVALPQILWRAKPSTFEQISFILWWIKPASAALVLPRQWTRDLIEELMSRAETLCDKGLGCNLMAETFFEL